MINRYAVPAEFNPDYLKAQPYDMDFLTHMADKAEKNFSDTQDSLDKLSGLAGSLNPAPGNEEWAKKVGAKYTKELDDIATNFNKMNLSEIKSKANKLKSNFLNDSNVKTILNNREYYEKTLSPYLSKPENKFNINKIPYLDRNNKFQSNEMSYDGTLDYTPAIDYNKEIDDRLKDVEYEIAKSSGYEMKKDTTTGLWMIKINNGYKKVRELEQFKPVIEGLTNTFMNPNSPAAAYFRDLTERDNPGSYTKDFVKQYITDRSSVYQNTQDMTGANYDIIPGQFDKNKENKDDEDNVSTLSTPLRKHQVTANMNIDDIFSKVQFDKNGNLIDTKTDVHDPDYASKQLDPNNYNKGFMMYADQATKSINTKPEAEAYLEAQIVKNPELALYTQENAISILRDATKSLQSSNVTILKPGEKGLAKAQNEIFGKDGYGDLHERTIYAINANGDKTQSNYNSVTKALGYANGIPADILKKGSVTGIDVTGIDAGDYTVTLPNSKGTPVTLYVGSNDELKEIAKLSGAVNSLVYSGGGNIEVLKRKITVDNHLDTKHKVYNPMITIEDITTGEKEKMTLSELHKLTAQLIKAKLK